MLTWFSFPSLDTLLFVFDISLSFSLSMWNRWTLVFFEFLNRWWYAHNSELYRCCWFFVLFIFSLYFWNRWIPRERLGFSVRLLFWIFWTSRILMHTHNCIDFVDFVVLFFCSLSLHPYYCYYSSPFSFFPLSNVCCCSSLSLSLFSLSVLCNMRFWRFHTHISNTEVYTITVGDERDSFFIDETPRNF